VSLLLLLSCDCSAMLRHCGEIFKQESKKPEPSLHTYLMKKIKKNLIKFCTKNNKITLFCIILHIKVSRSTDAKLPEDRHLTPWSPPPAVTLRTKSDGSATPTAALYPPMRTSLRRPRSAVGSVPRPLGRWGGCWSPGRSPTWQRTR